MGPLKGYNVGLGISDKLMCRLDLPRNGKCNIFQSYLQQTFCSKCTVEIHNSTTAKKQPPQKGSKYS